MLCPDSRSILATDLKCCPIYVQNQSKTRVKGLKPLIQNKYNTLYSNDRKYFSVYCLNDKYKLRGCKKNLQKKRWRLKPKLL